MVNSLNNPVFLFIKNDLKYLTERRIGCGLTKPLARMGDNPSNIPERPLEIVKKHSLNFSMKNFVRGKF